MCLDLFGCCLRKHGERVGLCRQIRETFIFSCISFPITEQYFWGLRPDFSANIFLPYHVCKQFILYFWTLKKIFSKFLIPPSRKIMARPLRCSYHVRKASTLCLDHLITRIFFLVGKSHFLFYQNSYLPYVIKYPFKVFSGQC